MEQQNTLKNAALSFESPTTKKVTDLEVLNINYPIVDKEGKDDEGKLFKYKVVQYMNEDYRIPNSVLSQIKALLGGMPALENFKVTKSGTGLQTRYQVIPVVTKA